MSTLTEFGFVLPPMEAPKVNKPTLCSLCRCEVLGCDPADCKYHGWPMFIAKTTARDRTYYDLIELPSRRHIPVPIMARHVGWKVIDEIPQSHKVRDSKFFYCGRCHEQDLAWINEGYKGLPYRGSFFRCRDHRPVSKEEDLSKLRELQLLVDEDRLDAMSYIRAVERRRFC